MRAFLLYITEHSLANRYERIKEAEHRMGSAGAQTRIRPCRRQHRACPRHELRQRLEKYFATDGAQEPYVITIPKGMYKPEFLPRAKTAELPAIESKPSETIAPAAPIVAPSRRRWLAISIAANLVLIAILLLVLFERPNIHQENVPQSVSLRDFWAQIFSPPDGGLKVVPADTGFALWQDLSGHNLNLGDYLSRRFLSLSDDQLREVAMRRSTSPADVVVTTRLGCHRPRIQQPLQRPVRPRH